jgi:Cof subfamily protein (haloacid dehalogenase superfamily)
MAYKIVFFDIDGTLVDEDKQIPQDTIDALDELKRSGAVAVIATGRAPYFFRPLAKRLGIDSFVSLNGAYTVYRGEVLYKQAIPLTSLETLVRQAAANGHPLVFEGSDTFFTNVEDHPHVFEAVSSLRVELPGFDPEYWRKQEIFQAFLHCEPHEEHLYAKAFSDLRLIRWHEKAMDVLIHGGSKAKGIEAMLQMLNISPSEAIAFGDGLNDKEMLSYVGLGIAMGNSHPELLSSADYVTSDVDNKGISQGLRYAGMIS